MERRAKMEMFERSEEHTSELQSLRHLVCRLLLEKNRIMHGTFTLSARIILTTTWRGRATERCFELARLVEVATERQTPADGIFLPFFFNVRRPPQDLPPPPNAPLSQ